jgi:hypothetical protein
MNVDYTLERHNSISIDRLRDLLGHDALLLHWPRGVKGTKQKWGHLTIEAMSDQRYLEKLATGNVGVALGAKSNGLCVVDFDADGEDEKFLALNPALVNTLRTHGRRGSSFWLRVVGDYPASKKLKAGGRELGEWRANGNQSIVAGIHPDTKQPYQMLNEANPVEIEFGEINWPDGVSFTASLPLTPAAPAAETTTVRSHSLTSFTTSPACSACSAFTTSQTEIAVLDADEEAAILQCVPTDIHQNHDLIFKLARAVKGLEKKSGTSISMPRSRAIIVRWHGLSLRFLRPGQSLDDYFFEFLAALECVKYPLGEGVLDIAWKNAQSATPPPEAMILDDPGKRLLVCLCRELQRASGDISFYLAARTIQRLFRQEHPMEGWRWLGGLCRIGILKLTKRGRKRGKDSAGETNEYKYLPKIPKADSKGIAI